MGGYDSAVKVARCSMVMELEIAPREGEWGALIKSGYFSPFPSYTHTGRSGCKGIEIKLAVAAEVDPKWMVVDEHVEEEDM